jgi:hypothetical protein
MTYPHVFAPEADAIVAAALPIAEDLDDHPRRLSRVEEETILEAALIVQARRSAITRARRSR